MSTATPSTLRPLPTPEELNEVEQILSDAHDECEFIAGVFVSFARSFEYDGIVPEVLPTDADVGRFYLFAHYLELRSQELHDMAERIVAELPELGNMAANVKLAEGGVGDDA